MKNFLFKSYWGNKMIVVLITIAIPAVIILSTMLLDFFVRAYSN